MHTKTIQLVCQVGNLHGNINVDTILYLLGLLVGIKLGLMVGGRDRPVRYLLGFHVCSNTLHVQQFSFGVVPLNSLPSRMTRSVSNSPSRMRSRNSACVMSENSLWPSVKDDFSALCVSIRTVEIKRGDFRRRSETVIIQDNSKRTQSKNVTNTP